MNSFSHIPSYYSKTQKATEKDGQKDSLVHPISYNNQCLFTSNATIPPSRKAVYFELRNAFKRKVFLFTIQERTSKEWKFFLETV